MALAAAPPPLHAAAGAGVTLAAEALAAEPPPWPYSPLGAAPPLHAAARAGVALAAAAAAAEFRSALPLAAFRRKSSPPVECQHAEPGVALAAAAAAAESPPPPPPAPQRRATAEAAKQPPTLSQQHWPAADADAVAEPGVALAEAAADAVAADEASSSAAAASVTGQHNKKKNKQQRRVEAARPESPERPLRHVEEAVRPESPQRLQQVAHQLSDENLQLRRRIFELEAELLLLRQQPRTMQRLER